MCILYLYNLSRKQLVLQFTMKIGISLKLFLKNKKLPFHFFYFLCVGLPYDVIINVHKVRKSKMIELPYVITNFKNEKQTL